MADDIAVEIAKQVPSLIVLGWIVVRFLSALRDEREECTKIIKELIASYANGKR